MSLMDDWVEPSVDDLAAIEAESGLISAGVAVVDAESAYLRSGDEITARRLAKARATELSEELLVQRRRTLAHTASAVSRAGQVIPLIRRNASAVASGAA
ncbi:DUF6284 family protein [Actinoalloteichus hymeniacidonis]|uniref:Uncharacterized protein n=1 Tax=Actinoalloteichus hymeniacidonis TaxID=340345 RepID=A0AAC9N039_9PSEU|nr:DUF6284 family protein [Actinoalloteichus hymeniacidonis]AOS65010.1 hypothetical protein TL08_21100 [Actinoalloteichus hymeniacidonis]MBB5906913.1 hypothetical protein [Actinoalloteichus hymeniacidonis]